MVGRKRERKVWRATQIDNKETLGNEGRRIANERERDIRRGQKVIITERKFGRALDPLLRRRAGDKRGRG